MNSLEPSIMNFPQTMLDTMDDITYAFYLAYGMTPEDEELDAALDVEMYSTIKEHVLSSCEASDSALLFGDTHPLEAACST